MKKQFIQYPNKYRKNQYLTMKEQGTIGKQMDVDKNRKTNDYYKMSNRRYNNM